MLGQQKVINFAQNKAFEVKKKKFKVWGLFIKYKN